MVARKLEGELTIYTAAQHKTDLLALVEAGEPVALDLAGVSEIDTAGLQLLWLVRREAATAGLQIAFLDASAPVRDMLRLTHLEECFAGEGA